MNFNNLMVQMTMLPECVVLMSSVFVPLHDKLAIKLENTITNLCQ